MFDISRNTFEYIALDIENGAKTTLLSSPMEDLINDTNIPESQTLNSDGRLVSGKISPRAELAASQKKTAGARL